MSNQDRIGWRNSPGRRQRPLHPALALYRPGAGAMRKGPVNAPLVSIHYGSAGIAYALYCLARSRGDYQLLVLARAWVQEAFALSSHPKAFYDPDLGITPETVGRVSLFHSAYGLHCVDALVNIALGDAASAARAIEAFVRRSLRPSYNPDLTGGAAGLLLGCAELVESAAASSLVDLSAVRMRGDEIAAGLYQVLQSEQIATSTRIRFLGIAHGWAGLVFALLRWTRAMRRDVAPLLATKLDELAALAIPYDGGVCWTMHNHSSSMMPGWCNGTAGYTMLFALAYELLHVQVHADLAERAAASTWSIETPHGSLCCGDAGNGYAFLAAYRLTGARVWLNRAHAASGRAWNDRSEFFFRDSLYEGPLGAAVLASELDHPATAAMPLFEPIRFNQEVS